jgi:dTDP-4-dehydrorhamnose 3,5-epimerase-like enzyme
MMQFIDTPIAGVWQVQTAPIADPRGQFTRLYCAQRFATVAADL